MENNNCVLQERKIPREQSDLLIPCIQNDSQSNLFHFSHYMYQDPYAYEICQDRNSASHQKSLREFCMQYTPDTPTKKFEFSKSARETDVIYSVSM